MLFLDRDPGWGMDPKLRYLFDAHRICAGEGVYRDSVYGTYL